jgi:hypothetical protein
MTQQHYDGKQVLSESESYVTNENGVTVLRRETILADGTRMTQETPLSSSGTTPHPGLSVASAPIEEPDMVIAPTTVTHMTTEVPFAQATCYPETPNYNMHGPSGSIALVTGPPQPPSGSIAVVTGTPQPPGVTVVPETTVQPVSPCRAALACLGPAVLCILVFIVVVPVLTFFVLLIKYIICPFGC